jgi:hypothetical protein
MAAPSCDSLESGMFRSTSTRRQSEVQVFTCHCICSAPAMLALNC